MVFNKMNSYVFIWVVQRITALFLIPLTFWFIYQCLSFQNLEYLELKIFFKSFINSFFFLLMMIAMLIHAKLGCETIVQDYISTNYIKIFFKRFINFIVFSSLFLVIVAIINLNIT